MTNYVRPEGARQWRNPLPGPWPMSPVADEASAGRLAGWKPPDEGRPGRSSDPAGRRASGADVH